MRNVWKNVIKRTDIIGHVFCHEGLLKLVTEEKHGGEKIQREADLDYSTSIVS